MNYFELFEIPVSFCPDKEKVKQQFYVLSRKYHPDFFSKEDIEAQIDALEKSAMVNLAYKTLTNSDSTMAYLLALRGIISENEKYDLPKDFLMEVMELNEELTDAKMENDSEKIAQVEKAIKALESEIYAPVKDIIETQSAGETTEKDLLQVKDFYFKKKYLDRILAATK